MANKPQSVSELLEQGQKPDVPAVAAAPVAAAPVAAPAAAPALAGIDAGLLGQLVSLMVAERAEALKTTQELKQRIQAVEKQRSRNSREQDAKRIAKQATCRHLKGVGKHTPKGAMQRIDYAVYLHRFVDFSERIQCRICAAKWRKGDTAEYFLRGGRQIPNHTHIGWLEAMRMVDQSSDTYTACESVVLQDGAASRAAVYTDKDGNKVTSTMVDKDGNLVSNFEL